MGRSNFYVDKTAMRGAERNKNFCQTSAKNFCEKRGENCREARLLELAFRKVTEGVLDPVPREDMQGQRHHLPAFDPLGDQRVQLLRLAPEPSSLRQSSATICSTLETCCLCPFGGF